MQNQQARQARQRKAQAKAIGCFGCLSAMTMAPDIKNYQAIQNWGKLVSGVPLECYVLIETLTLCMVKPEQLNEDWSRITFRPYQTVEPA